MLASVNGFVSWSAVFALLAVLPAASGAQEEEAKARQEGQAGEDRWVPSLALISGVTIQSQEASIETFNFDYVLDPPDDPKWVWMLNEDLSADGDDLAVSPYVGANLELMSPALPLPGRPRLFLGAEILPTFAAARDVAKIGDPTGFAPQDIPPPPLWPTDPGDPPRVEPCDDGEGGVRLSTRECYPRFGYTESGILGQGSQTTAEIDTLVFGAAVGVAFPFELRGRPLRVKPSFGWIRYKIDVEGRMLRATCALYDPTNLESNACISFDVVGPDAGPDGQHGFTREIVLGAQGSQSFNGIGGGLDIEMDVWRVGQFGVSLFLGGRFYRTLGDRTVDLSDEAEFPAETREPSAIDPPFNAAFLPANTFTAKWSFEVDPWMYRAGLGLRLHWLGSRK
jgi:hypothetical protein